MEWAILWYQATAYTTFVSWEIAAWEKKTCWMSSYHKVVIICANSMRKNGFCAQLKSAFLLYWRIVNFLKLLFFILKPKNPYIFTWFFRRCSSTLELESNNQKKKITFLFHKTTSILLFQKDFLGRHWFLHKSLQKPFQ